MRVLNVRNVNEALARAVPLMLSEGIRRDSRNGPVLQVFGPVTTVYTHPCERVLFSPERDANPFFHFYEMLWMVGGRRDVAGPVKFAKNMANYSDDGETFHGAYGYRWSHHFEFDQLEVIIKNLRDNPEDRRCVLSMWDARVDLRRKGKDLPCNLMATFQVNSDGYLDMVVFCRSNDIVWGAYGANAVHFSFLLEYMAARTGYPVGTYTHTSVNWHAYVDVFQQVAGLRPDRMNHVFNPYEHGVNRTPLADGFLNDSVISELLFQVDTNFENAPDGSAAGFASPLWAVGNAVLRAHQAYRDLTGEDRYLSALRLLGTDTDPLARYDWIIAAKAWLVRRHAKWATK